MSTYTPTIGLEIHAELSTKTKMFCNSANDPHAAEENTHICPVCMAFPGTLPTVNREAVKHVLKVGAALGGDFAEYTEFDRKNYFYPDIPKGYQISQYQYPLISGGSLAGVAITRIHLEEDTARSQHGNGPYSLIDFNRAGVPLMELVTEPVIHDAQTATKFAQELRLLLRTLGCSSANMEKGEMRVEANISVSSSEKLGTKVEVKNLNSFKVVGKAIEHEIKRQVEAIEKGEQIVQETRGWDENTGKTFSQRSKEDAQDYRYFPDPDIPKLNLSRINEFSKENIERSLPVLPEEKREKYRTIGLKEEDYEVLVSEPFYGDFFEEEVLKDLTTNKHIVISANYLLSDVRGSNPTQENIDNLRGGAFVGVVKMIAENTLSSRGAKDLLALLLKEGGDPETLAKEHNLVQVHDADAIHAVVKEVMAENESVVADVRAGKDSAIQFLVGQGMKKSKGSLSPGELIKILKKEIGV